MQDRIISREEAARLTGFHPHTLAPLIAKGKFPPPVDLGARRAGWRLSDVEAWIASRPAKKHEMAQATLDGRAAYWARVKAGEAKHPRTIGRERAAAAATTTTTA